MGKSREQYLLADARQELFWEIFGGWGFGGGWSGGFENCIMIFYDIIVAVAGWFRWRRENSLGWGNFDMRQNVPVKLSSANC